MLLSTLNSFTKSPALKIAFNNNLFITFLWLQECFDIADDLMEVQIKNSISVVQWFLYIQAAFYYKKKNIYLETWSTELF